MLVFLLIVGVLLAVVLIILRVWLNKLEEKTKISTELVAWMKELGLRVETSTQNVDQKLAMNMALFNNRLDNATAVIAQVQKNIGEFSEIGRSMQELQTLLQSPKLRGNIGAQILKEILAQNFPPQSYELQFSFKNGERVDAIIKTSNGYIPIDSKFPMTNFRKMAEVSDKTEKDKFRKEFLQDVKKHIEDISKKYILTHEGTCDYALMYIPSEAIYYEIINDASLFDFSGKHKVLPVSPLSFYAYMKAILMSFEGQRIESQAKEILKLLGAIKKDYEKMDESLSVLTRHITNAYNQSSQVSKQFISLGQKLSDTQLISSENYNNKKKLID